MAESENIMETALAKGTFSVLAAAKGRAYPQDIVDVHTDAESAYKAQAIENRINDLGAGEENANLVNTLDTERNALLATMKASSLTFLLRGINKGTTDGIIAAAKEKFGDITDPPNYERAEWVTLSYLAAHIVSVTDAENNVDDHFFTVTDVQELAAYLPEDQFRKLLALMSELTFAATYFDQAVSVDFSQRR